MEECITVTSREIRKKIQDCKNEIQKIQSQILKLLSLTPISLLQDRKEQENRLANLEKDLETKLEEEENAHLDDIEEESEDTAKVSKVKVCELLEELLDKIKDMSDE